MYNQYIDNHPATQGAKISDTVASPESKIARSNQNILLSKINAAMLIKCNAQITSDQIKELQKFKFKADKFYSSDPSFDELVNVPLT